MLSALVGESPALAPLKRLVLERTQGNPFFTEELVQALFDEAVLVRNGTVKLTNSLNQLKIPPTVQGILAARIDRLPSAEKQLLQTLAVIGQEFSLEVVRRLTDKPSDELDRMLAALQLGEFIYEQPAVGDIEYTFKHALTQEVAYNSVLLERRKSLHERAGVAMEAVYATRIDDHLSELASHYKRSGNSVKALEYLQRAGGQALARSSYAEAVGLFSSALELLKTLPAKPERMQQELALQRGLGSALIALKGFSTPEAIQTLEYASELCRQIGNTPLLFGVLRALAGTYFARGELRRANELGRQLLAIAEEKLDPVFLIWAHSLGMIQCAMGEFTLARTHLERGISIYDPTLSEAYRAVYSVLDPGITCTCWSAITICFLGFPEQSVEKSREAVVLARKLGLPFTLAVAMVVSAHIHLLRREGETSLAIADESQRFATEHSFGQMSAWAAVRRGSALIELDRTEGIVPLQDGIAGARAAGWEFELTSFLAALGDGYGKAGCAIYGLKAIADAFAVSEKTGARWYDAELHRLKGELLLKDKRRDESKSEDEAQDCFHQALEIARRQRAKWWELRATVSLARLLVKQGCRDKARTMLAEIYGWFTEGFDTADLKDAKALLDELGVVT